jgi:hypothetical protein
MRYSDPAVAEPLYINTPNMQYTLLFAVVLAFFIGAVLLYLGRRGRVLWLTVWSIGLMISSLIYVGAYFAGMTESPQLL